MRQSAYSFKELVERFEEGGDRSCFFLNEIGCFMEEGGPEAPKAEAYLRKLLEGKEIQAKTIAFCYLSSSRRIAQDTAEKVAAFKEDPTNQAVLVEAVAAARRGRQKMMAVN